MQKSVFGIAVLTAAALSGIVSTSQAAQTRVSIPVVAGAIALSAIEKGAVDGQCGCEVPPPPPPPTCPTTPPPAPAPTKSKPGYGFGTTGHYGPPGQGFTPARNWRGVVAAGGTTTPKGNALPPRAFR